MKGKGSVSRVRSVAIPVLAVFWMLWCVAPAIGAAPGPDPLEPEPLPLEVRSYAEDAGVSAEEAERRLEVQLEGAGIVGQLQRSLGDDYAGVWFDNKAGKFVVPVVGAAARSAAAAELAKAGLVDDYRTTAVGSTWAELEAAQKRLDHRLRDLIEASLVQTSRDPIVNGLVVHVSSDAGEATVAEIRRAISGLGVEVETRRESASRFEVVPAACNEPVRVCDRPLRGGVKIEPLSGGWCSAGFKATGKLFANRFMLTAGHCTKGTSAWRSRNSATVPQEMGVVEETVFPGRDYGKIRVNGTYWDQEPWPTQVAHWGVNHSSGISWEGWNYLGQYVCHSGATSGASCGWVQTLGMTVNYSQGAVGNLVEVQGPSYCVMGGDSGGPIFAGNVALGLMSGRLEEEPCSKVGFHAEITEATSALGVTVAPRIGKPARPDELGFLRYNYPGNTFLDTYTRAPKYNLLASHSTTGYPAISDPQNIQGLAIDWTGDGIDELGFVRLNHFTGNAHLDTYVGAPNYKVLASNCDTGYPAIKDPQNVQVLAIDWTGDGVDELGFLRYNPKTGATHLDTYVGAPCYQTLASSSLTGYPEILDPQNIQGLALNTG